VAVALLFLLLLLLLLPLLAAWCPRLMTGPRGALL